MRQLITSHDECLNAVSLVPGSEGGMGSGVRIEFKQIINFDLICLYSNVKAERFLQHNQNARLMAKSNKLLKLDAILEEGNVVLTHFTYNKGTLRGDNIP